ncbi:hypothetical protein BQ8794_60081 [Mesorhizobium prunaredense]|uniref:Uncharacterized protein n=1 Tax=Mesorhizobium prunaredense TaxID=1631249 RepID=A0A1R3VFS7_9HYPH|nr:hypothetical protein BQ8794_60081 [Mesorhizobium prunaredense]
MPGFDGKQARSITRTPPKYKLFGNAGPGAWARGLAKAIWVRAACDIRHRSQLLAMQHHTLGLP